MKYRGGIFGIILFFSVVVSLGLFLFSYTQIDLNQTLSQVGLLFDIQQRFQKIGYFMRPLATTWYIVQLVSSFILYLVILFLIAKKKITWKQTLVIIGVTVALLVFSYPAFSYDIYNYMFTAKTVLVYQKNPYTVIPLEFSGVEPWLTFMRWTHLPSAYTPLWIATTLPSYLLGFGYFLPVLWNFKLLLAFWYIVAVWFLGKILDIVDPKMKTLGVAMFALQPLIIIETLVSAHNDMMMMAIVLASIYAYLKNKMMLSYILLALSVATKLMTIFLYPVAFLKWRREWALLAMSLAFIAVCFQREVLPWYFVWVMPFVALLPRSKPVFILSLGLSLGLLLRYAPFFYLGHYNDPVPVIKTWVTMVPFALSACVALAVAFFTGKREVNDHSKI